MDQRTKPSAFKLFATLLFVLPLFIIGCEQETSVEDHKPEVAQTVTDKDLAPSQEKVDADLPSPGILLSDPFALLKFESISEAMPVWREFADQQPILLLLSDKPQIIPPPEILREQIDHLVKTGSSAAINTAGNSRNSEVLFQHSMSVDIALRNEWFKGLDWIFPSRDPELSPRLELIREQFIAHSILDDTEANTLALEGKVINGRLRGKAFRASALKWVTKQDTPVIVHIDLSYFQTLYKNEIATPILQTIYTTLSQLKDLQLNSLVTTFSYSHIDNNIALDVRFLGEIISTLIANPDMLKKPVPANWQRQADAIYLASFFQKDKIEELFKAQLQDDSNSAWIKFNLYRSAAARKSGQQALEFLAEAVTLDPAYALEYANLSQLAYEKKRPDEALRMLSLAARVYPDDPFIKLRMIQLAIELGEKKTATHLIEQLQKLSWSDVYYANMPDRLNVLAEGIKSERE